jgi:hypothetical protein
MHKVSAFLILQISSEVTRLGTRRAASDRSVKVENVVLAIH